MKGSFAHIQFLPGLLFRRPVILCTCFFLSVFAHSQTTNISGVVNTYHKVAEVIPAKACVRVVDPTGLNINSLVMLVQMKGVSMNTANNSSFGDTTSLNTAGNYEIGTICYIIGDSVFLFHNLLNSYDAASKLQLVQFGEYYSANVVDTVKAQAWDSATGTGGVIAIFADQDITLNAPIYADSLGNAGGAYYNNNATCNFIQTAGTGYAYDITAANNNNGAYKGEGAADIPANLNSAKGAPANGGGGGNNHNNSGGGGANLVAGGSGGGNSSSGPSGCNVANNWGRAGKALSNWSNAKIFMGGGGGAGHSNNGGLAFNHGGDGGGIIFIWSNTFNGNGYKITAGGGNGAPSQSDGAGGGGAGGTVIMTVNAYSGSLTINAKGGNGGLSDDGSVVGRCFGGGGGGSGGAIYFNSAIPAVTYSVTGGTAGGEINRDAGCAAAVSGVNGNNGLVIPNYDFRRSLSPAGYCHFLLPARILFFNAVLNDHWVDLSWELDLPEEISLFIPERKSENGDWEPMPALAPVANKTRYAATDPQPRKGNNFYRLKIIGHDGAIHYTDIKKVWFTGSAVGFSIYPNPARDRLVLNGYFDPAIPVIFTDINGRKIFEKRISGSQALISLPLLRPGIYIVRYGVQIRKLQIR